MVLNQIKHDFANQGKASNAVALPSNVVSLLRTSLLNLSISTANSVLSPSLKPEVESSGRPWPRGHILKSLSLASKPQVLENCPVLGSRTAQFFEQLKFRWKTTETSRKICEHLFLFSSLGA